MNAQQIIAQRSLRSEFSTLEMASDVRERMTAGHAIILGDNNKFWILPNRYAKTLISAGYELAN